ncbi:phosphoenolpyruvate carboxylase [Leuconostoc carnosum]|uniref:Phosphoenolpyruvate carboxylase n=1 Tax=Leuconostoc carnosum (strain JB16) TaxID=1229758 RepID=K0D932_LEUCJ|nr:MULTISPECIES: phosphoenolpyruvate carboxylase [Leuconostoc]AFT81283.1 phosphoenolpyruvate carboxylase [Leuconostoc carnosum JB16]KAA8326615.1 phosphoenolpyruvate carboxylase [Leuconostoc carnosum]KAA8330102.1 phosphoenolpyruvate carboxylase [Leuconostoc carnosum]KAA8362176.1 phosphoenolpyruvate carboxylase [Leuconostoc carnosum]KAA8366725.1 phosphoenolpyruvate carboxylase [Leuconostoc carnosum]
MAQRKIPSIMGTQHPDNANAPFWDSSQQPFISAYREMNEAFENFSELDVDEYMWDWEGKHADAAVIDRLFSTEYDYFKSHQIGRDKFLTFRFPNIWEEKGYNLMQAMTAILSSEDFSHDLGFDQRPLFETILPMTQRADQLIEMQILFEKLAKFKSVEFTKSDKNNPYIEMIPLFEDFNTQLHAPEILKTYLKLHEEHFGFRPKYLRVFLAGSDSALTAGFMSSITGNKLAIARLHEFAQEENIEIYPISGTGSAIFRGGLSPKRIQRYLKEFPGVRTATVQSAFRYDFPLEEVTAAITELKAQLPVVEPLKISAADQKILTEVAEESAEFYAHTLDQLVPDMQPIFKAFPKRRDRRQHVGVLGYSRSVDGIELPRAINFTGAFYSIGVPPEFIGFGRALKNLKPSHLETFVRHYPSMADDFRELANYVNLDALEILKTHSSAWADVARDIMIMKDIFNLEIGPKTREQQQHAEIALQVVQIKEGSSIAITALINRMAQLRHFLG